MSITDIVYSKSSHSIYSCSEDQTIIQWDASSGEQQQYLSNLILFALNQIILFFCCSSFKRDTYPIHKLCLNHQETVLSSGSSTIKLWDLSSKKILKKFQGHSQPVTCLKFDYGDHYLISCTKDRFISLWNCSNESESKQAIQGF